MKIIILSKKQEVGHNIQVQKQKIVKKNLQTKKLDPGPMIYSLINESNRL